MPIVAVAYLFDLCEVVRRAFAEREQRHCRPVLLNEPYPFENVRMKDKITNRSFEVPASASHQTHR